MKKILVLVIALFLTTTVITQAAPLGWDLTSNVLKPAAVAWNAVIRGAYFQATSTTQTNTFPLLTTTNATATTICFTGDNCRTTWPTGGGATTTINNASGPSFIFATGTATGIGLTLSTTTGTITFTPTVSSGYSIPLTASTTQWNTAFASTTNLTPTFIRSLFSNTVTGLTYTAGTGVTALTAGFAIPSSTDFIGWNLASSSRHSAVTLSGALDYITLVGQDIVRGAVDLATDITGFLGITNGGTGTSTAPTTDQILVGRAGGAYDYRRITAGTNVTVSTSTAGQIKISATGGGTGTSTKTYSYIVAATGGDYTTIQGAIDACSTAGGGSIFLADSLYAQGATGLRWKGNGCHIYGKGSGTTTITFTGATTLFKTNSAAATYSNVGVHNVVITADGNTSGIAFDISDMSNQHYSNIIADNIGTFIRINDTQDITFYNTFEKFYATTITAFGLNASSTNPTNGNRFIDGFFGYGANVTGAQFNNSNGTLFQSIRLEPSSTTGTKGLFIWDSPATDGVFGNNFDDLYIEGNAVGIQINGTTGSGGGIKRNVFSGMVEANTSDLTLGTNIARDNTFVNITDSFFGNPITSYQTFFGIGTTSPVEEFAVTGDTYVTGTSSVLGLVLRGASGFLKATAGNVATSLVNLATDITGTLADDNGGTGQSTYATGDTLYASGVNTLAKRTIGSTGNVLSVVGGVPSWSATSTLSIALSDTTGTLSATRGGTAQSTYATGDMLYSSGANTLSKLTIGSTGQVLQVIGGIPTWVATSSLGISGGGGSASGTINSASIGQGAYYTGATTLSGTNSMYVPATNKLSVGTTTTVEDLTVAGGIAAYKPGTTPVIMSYATNGSDFVQMYSSGGFGQLEASDAFVLTAPGGTTVVGTSDPQFKVQYGGATYRSLEFYHDDTNAYIYNNATAGNIMFKPGTASTSVVMSQATTTVRHSSSLSGFLQASLARLTVGIEHVIGYYRSGRLFGALTIKGLFYQEEWNQVDCSVLNGAIAISADGVTGCDGFAFYEDGTATLTSTAKGGNIYSRLSTSATADGAGVFLNAPTAGGLFIATSTPVFQATARIHTVQNQGTTTQTFIGFSNIASAGTTYETAPTAGCFFTASTTIANWRAICRTSLAAQTNVDTGIASTTVTTGDGVPYRFMIETGNNKATFYIQSSEAGNLTQVADITTNVPNTVAMNAGIHFGRAQGLTAVGVDVYDMNIGWRKVIAI